MSFYFDSPGHKDLVPNRITGVTQAAVAVLVADASSKGSFEAGMESNRVGQTREHTQLIRRSFAVDQIIVAVNKILLMWLGYFKERSHVISYRPVDSRIHLCVMENRI